MGRVLFFWYCDWNDEPITRVEPKDKRNLSLRAEATDAVKKIFVNNFDDMGGKQRVVRNE